MPAKIIPKAQTTLQFVKDNKPSEIRGVIIGPKRKTAIILDKTFAISSPEYKSRAIVVLMLAGMLAPNPQKNLKIRIVNKFCDSRDPRAPIM